MKSIAVTFAVLLGLVVVPASRAEEPPALLALRAQLMSSSLVLADYSADATRKYQYESGVLQAQPPAAREFALYVTSKVELHGSTLVIEGLRRFVVSDSMTHTLVPTAAASPMKLSIDLKKANPDEVLPKLRTLLFKATMRDAVDGVPDYRAKSVPATWDRTKKTYVGCDPCGKGSADAWSASLVDIKQPETAPRLTKQVDPEFTEEARAHSPMNAEVEVGLIVDAEGKPQAPWVVRAVGLGLDEEAVKAVRQYRFAPATKDGKPVAVNLNIAVNFTLLDRR